MIVWTHGTSGVARACAPSAMRNVYYGPELAKMVEADKSVPLDGVKDRVAQPWSNGNVGMANWSWAGMSQIATASTVGHRAA